MEAGFGHPQIRGWFQQKLHLDIFANDALFAAQGEKHQPKKIFMKCRSCGKFLFESDTHCPDCGVSIQRQPGETLLGIFIIIAGLVLLFLLVRKNF